jgi:glutathione S-transferase
MPELISLAYSPWSEKARWALDRRGVEYERTEYLIMLGELWLRIRARKATGRVSVPLLIDGDRIYTDSFEIARYAEWFGRGAALMDDMDAVTRWNEQSERALSAGRVLLTERIARDPEAKREQLPPFVPRALRSALSPVATVGIAFMRRKWDFDHVARAETRLEDTLAQLREALGGGDYLLGSFSYADIAMAVVLQMVSPVDERYIRLGPATKRAWTHPDLARDYEDLVAWRDRLYERHR